MANTLAAVFSINDRYTAAITKIIKSQDTYEKKTEKIDKLTQKLNRTMDDMKNSAGKASTGIDSLAGKLTGLISIAYLGKKAFDSMFSSVNLAATQKTHLTTFQALLGNDASGSALYKYASEYAKTSALGREELSRGLTSALTMTRDREQIQQYIKMVERLYAKAPEQGTEGAVFALKEALTEGSVLSLRNRFGITGLSGDDLREADMEGKLKMLDDALNRFGATQEVVDRNFTGLLAQSSLFATNLRSEIAEQAQPVMETFAGVFQRLNAEMQTGKYQPFIDMMVNGMSMVGSAVAWVAENLNTIVPTVSGVVAALVVYKGAMMAAATATAIMNATVNPLAAALTALAAVAGIGVSNYISTKFDANEEVGRIGSELDRAWAGISDLGKLDVEVANTDPIKVKGEVQIEEENLRYLMDIANKKFLAQYSHTVMAPQNVFNMQITKEVDADGVVDIIADTLEPTLNALPVGG